MLSKIKQSKQEGFTIIEVMIVLAIAGLIMVVVFLAVPALQRSGRNNSLNSSANNILTAVGDYASNNNGQLPTTPTLTPGSSVKFDNAAGNGNASSGAVDASIVSVVVDAGAAPITKASPVGTVEVVKGANAVCNSTASGLSGVASARSYVVLYVAESGSGNVLKCIGG